MYLSDDAVETAVFLVKGVHEIEENDISKIVRVLGFRQARPERVERAARVLGFYKERSAAPKKSGKGKGRARHHQKKQGGLPRRLAELQMEWQEATMAEKVAFLREARATDASKEEPDLIVGMPPIVLPDAASYFGGASAALAEQARGEAAEAARHKAAVAIGRAARRFLARRQKDNKGRTGEPAEASSPTEELAIGGGDATDDSNGHTKPDKDPSDVKRARVA